MSGKDNARKHLLASACFGLALTLPAVSQNRPIGEVVSSDATVKGSVVLVGSGMRVMSGSSITAGTNTASLKLIRGGEVRVCPRATLSLTNSQSGRDMVFAMGTGVVETHYALGSNADTILTPDFRILLAGPGTFNFAFGADARGNTCVRSLPGDTASIIITEQMGDGVYQVRPGEQAYFRNGTVNGAQKTLPPDCGCPDLPPAAVATAPATPVATPGPPTASVVQLPSFSAPQQPSAGNQVQTPAAANPAPPSGTPAPTVELPANSPEAVFAEHGRPTVAPETPSSATAKPPETAPAPPDNEIHIQVDAPFVFRGDQPAPAPPAPTLATLHLSALPHAFTEELAVLPPAQSSPAPAQPTAVKSSAGKHKGVFGHIRSFFAAIFR